MFIDPNHKIQTQREFFIMHWNTRFFAIKAFIAFLKKNKQAIVMNKYLFLVQKYEHFILQQHRFDYFKPFLQYIQ